MRIAQFLLPAILCLVLLSSCSVEASDRAVPNFSVKTLSYVPKLHDEAHLMDLYIPSRAAKPMPVILWIHGGAWLMGDKEDTPALFFMKSGYAVASINYRYSSEAIFPAQIEDAKAAVRWIRANAEKYHFDTKRIVAFGNSAGGHLAALLGTTGDVKPLEGNLGNADQSSKVQAVVDWCGPTDFIGIEEQGDAKNQLRPRDPKGPVAKLFGGLPSKKRELAAAASPVTFVSNDDPPFLIMHGDHDNVVPIKQSSDFYEVLKAAHVKVLYHVVKNGGHNFFSAENLQIVENWLKNTLR
ncbi:MAG TPA: alpha/beta hydrolase [Drouetiella sp.]|jgi:acetyl esterase/lipase